ncbi:MAG: VRR-NUC domain-containing protein [Chromatiales bacterium]|nr:VRR-NUC domain-containing protein [Chromatiales bacterium]
MTRESDIEAAITQYAEVHGWWQCKFTSPSFRGVPDRIFIRKGRHVFIELKAPGETASPQQQKRHREMRMHGAEVYVVDSIEEGYAVLR